ncbi:hypothetical protein BAE44_0024146 [Dichanthelium oligosanthes]|uniref:Uncharacterized protein n=1 Tax=Dichanthelium oligosanthes TaxID=888268 RepID=A0A1E5UPV1_9POAL|nr:hypothetical protein BAE44_0024146 [Dichanthelium oligosanthes]
MAPRISPPSSPSRHGEHAATATTIICSSGSDDLSVPGTGIPVPSSTPTAVPPAPSVVVFVPSSSDSDEATSRPRKAARRPPEPSSAVAASFNGGGSGGVEATTAPRRAAPRRRRAVTVRSPGGGSGGAEEATNQQPNKKRKYNSWIPSDEQKVLATMADLRRGNLGVLPQPSVVLKNLCGERALSRRGLDVQELSCKIHNLKDKFAKIAGKVANGGKPPCKKWDKEIYEMSKEVWPDVCADAGAAYQAAKVVRLRKRVHCSGALSTFEHQ